MLLTPSVKNVLINITNRCNLECKHCYVSSSPSGEMGLSVNTWLRVVENVVSTFPGVTVAISGGEPLVRMKLVEALLCAIGSSAVPFILTNGHYYNKRFFSTIAKYNPRMRISIDGGNEETHDFIRGRGSFKRTIEGIKNLEKYGYDMSKVEVFCTLQPNKEDLLHDIISICESYSINKIKVEPIAKTGRANEFWPKTNIDEYNDSDHDSFAIFFDDINLMNWKVHDFSDMSFSSLTVYSNGDVYPFVYYDENDKKSALLGNVNTDDLCNVLDKDKIHHAIVSKIFTAYRGGRRGLNSKILIRNRNE